jgi:hypothetical protein
MKNIPRRHWLAAWSLTLVALACGCIETTEPTSPGPKEGAKAKKVPVGKNVTLEVRGKHRRVLVQASVCLRVGQLEQFLCRKGTKEHEATLAADVDARDIHRALLLAGGREGKPVQYAPKYRPATGQKIRVTVEYEEKGKKVSVPAQKWIKNVKTGKELDSDWVFAGSRLVPNRLDRNQPKMYLANDGDVICVSNFETALLDLPIKSPKDTADLVFETFTERIPKLNTRVTVILEPIPEKK